MASPTIQGTGIWWSVGNVTHNLAGTFNHQSVDLSSTAEVKKIKNASGQTVTFIWYDLMDELTFESVPVGAAGITNATVTLPTFGAKITVSGGPAASLNTATWMVDSPYGLKFDNEGVAKFTCKLTRAESVTPV